MLAKIVKEDQRNWDLYIPSKYLAYSLVGNFDCLMTCFNHTPAFPNISFILSTIPNSSQGWRALSRSLAKLWSQGIASHSKGLLWPLENQHLSSRRPSPLVRQENPEGQVYETGKVEWSDLQDQVLYAQLGVTPALKREWLIAFSWNSSTEPATRIKAGPRLREDLLWSCVVLQHKRAVMRKCWMMTFSRKFL